MTKKTILLASLLLLGCWGSAEAGSGTVDIESGRMISCSMENGSPRFKPRADGRCYSADAETVTQPMIWEHLECERRMEAAMRAMEPWMLRAVVDPVDGKRITNFVPFDASMERTESFQLWKDALVKWDTTKRDCWRNP